MFTLKVRNARGEFYELTHNRGQYTVDHIGGLLPTKNNISISDSGAEAGGVFNAAHMEVRNLVISIVLEGDIEANRQQLYRIFPQDAEVTVFFRDAYRDLMIGARVETVDGDPFSTRERVQVSLLCPDPFWQDVHGLRAETEISEEDGTPVCRIVNAGDTKVGFTATVRISTEDEPVLERSATESASPEELRRDAILRQDDFFDTLDLSSQTLNLYVNNVLQEETDYQRDMMLRADGHTRLWVHFPQGGLAGAAVTAEKITVEGQDLTDMRYFESAERVQSSYIVISGIPSWFDIDSDCIVFSYTEGAVGRVIPTSMRAEQQEDGTWTLYADFEADLTKKFRLELYGSVSHADVHDATILRVVSAGWRPTTYTSSILDPVLPAYTARDIFRVYCGADLTEGYAFETVTMLSDSSEHTLFYLTGDAFIDHRITFEVYSSTEGADVHDWTQAQIDAGLCLVTGLVFANRTTGEEMPFEEIKFQSGDVFEISTYAGHLSVTVTESSWMPAGTSLLYAVYRTGTFFRLVQGANVLGFTAESNADYVSAEIVTRQLYRGV